MKQENISIVKNCCFDKKIEEEILSQITEETTRDDLFHILRNYTECIGLCNNCGEELEFGDDGRNTSYGTCQECIQKGMDDE